MICLKDLQSMHGTYVDSVRVTSDTWTVISEGSTLMFGAKNAAEGECAKYTLCQEPRSPWTWMKGQAGEMDVHLTMGLRLQR